MEAKDTVMKEDYIAFVLGVEHWSNLTKGQLLDANNIAETQSRISFKAGIKEVVDWLKNHHALYYMKDEGDTYLGSSTEWQAKLKEWGIES